ncbi:MAG: hypothetical protein JSS66_06185 [Armatimonadetes bacterium]|nr:hypothetical protein [Armatimonadota bacterium]
MAPSKYDTDSTIQLMGLSGQTFLVSRSGDSDERYRTEHDIPRPLKFWHWKEVDRCVLYLFTETEKPVRHVEEWIMTTLRDGVFCEDDGTVWFVAAFSETFSKPFMSCVAVLDFRKLAFRPTVLDRMCE